MEISPNSVMEFEFCPKSSRADTSKRIDRIFSDIRFNFGQKHHKSHAMKFIKKNQRPPKVFLSIWKRTRNKFVTNFLRNSFGPTWSEWCPTLIVLSMGDLGKNNPKCYFHFWFFMLRFIREWWDTHCQSSFSYKS